MNTPIVYECPFSCTVNMPRAAPSLLPKLIRSVRREFYWSAQLIGRLTVHPKGPFTSTAPVTEQSVCGHVCKCVCVLMHMRESRNFAQTNMSHICLDSNMYFCNMYLLGIVEMLKINVNSKFSFCFGNE